MAVVHANSNVQEARAQLTAAMGDDNDPDYVLAEQPQPPLLEDDVNLYIREALANRPDLKALNLQAQAAQQYANSESKLNYPTVNILGTAGEVPDRDHTLQQNYGAAGINISVPVFNGGLYSGRIAEAKLRAQAADRDVRDRSLRDRARRAHGLGAGKGRVPPDPGSAGPRRPDRSSCAISASALRRRPGQHCRAQPGAS